MELNNVKKYNRTLKQINVKAEMRIYSSLRNVRNEIAQNFLFNK